MNKLISLRSCLFAAATVAFASGATATLSCFIQSSNLCTALIESGWPVPNLTRTCAGGTPCPDSITVDPTVPWVISVTQGTSGSYHDMTSTNCSAYWFVGRCGPGGVCFYIAPGVSGTGIQSSVAGESCAD